MFSKTKNNQAAYYIEPEIKSMDMTDGWYLQITETYITEKKNQREEEGQSHKQIPPFSPFLFFLFFYYHWIDDIHNKQRSKIGWQTENPEWKQDTHTLTVIQKLRQRKGARFAHSKQFHNGLFLHLPSLVVGDRMVSVSFLLSISHITRTSSYSQQLMSFRSFIWAVSTHHNPNPNPCNSHMQILVL